MSVGASSNFVENGAGKIVCSVIENLIERYHSENVLWDVNNANFMNLEFSAALNLPTGNIAI